MPSKIITYLTYECKFFVFRIFEAEDSRLSDAFAVEVRLFGDGGRLGNESESSPGFTDNLFSDSVNKRRHEKSCKQDRLVMDPLEEGSSDMLIQKVFGKHAASQYL